MLILFCSTNGAKRTDSGWAFLPSWPPEAQLPRCVVSGPHPLGQPPWHEGCRPAAGPRPPGAPSMARFSLPRTRPACPAGSDQISLSHILCLHSSLFMFPRKQMSCLSHGFFLAVDFNPVWTGQALLLAQPPFCAREPRLPVRQGLLPGAEVHGTLHGAPQRWWAGTKGRYKANLHFILL